MQILIPAMIFQKLHLRDLSGLHEHDRQRQHTAGTRRPVARGILCGAGRAREPQSSGRSRLGKPSFSCRIYMTRPANIRKQSIAGAPFPAVVKASAPASIAKANGNLGRLGMKFRACCVLEQPTILQQQTDYLLVWDSVVGNFFTIPLSAITSGGIGGSGTQRPVTGRPAVVVSLSDQDPQSQSCRFSHRQIHVARLCLTSIGVPLTFKDVGRQATANPLTLAASGWRDNRRQRLRSPLNTKCSIDHARSPRRMTA